jgi:hypothetical protein
MQMDIILASIATVIGAGILVDVCTGDKLLLPRLYRNPFCKNRGNVFARKASFELKFCMVTIGIACAGLGLRVLLQAM